MHTIYGFEYTEVSLHSRLNLSYLFNVLSNLVCKYFVENIHIYIYQVYSSVVFSHFLKYRSSNSVDFTSWKTLLYWALFLIFLCPNSSLYTCVNDSVLTHWNLYQHWSFWHQNSYYFSTPLCCLRPEETMWWQVRMLLLRLNHVWGENVERVNHFI